MPAATGAALVRICAWFPWACPCLLACGGGRGKVGATRCAWCFLRICRYGAVAMRGRERRSGRGGGYIKREEEAWVMRGRISCIRTGLAGAPHCPVPCLPRVSPAPERQTHPGPGFHRSPPQRRQGGNRNFVLATRWSARPRRTHPHTTALPLPGRCNARFAKGRRITCACGAVRASLHLPRTTVPLSTHVLRAGCRYYQ